MDIIPMLLPGTQAALRDDLGSSTAELVYGAPLRLLLDFFSASDDTNYANQLCSAVQVLWATPHVMPSSHLAFIPQQFSTCTHLFIQCDAVQKLLQKPYDEPFKVLQRSDKTFILGINGGHDTVSLHRLL